MNQSTQRDIATSLGISQPSVSRALRGDQRISDSVRSRVLKAARKLGYQPDPAVKALASYRWKKHPVPKGLSLALLTNSPEPKWTGIDELRAAIKSSGYLLDVIDLKKGYSPKALLRVLKARGVSGIIIFTSDGIPVSPEVKAACETYPAVSWNNRLLNPPCPSVVRDAYHRIADCCQAMTQKKYQNAAIIIPGNPEEFLTDWIREMHAAWLYHSRAHPGWHDVLFAKYNKENWDELAKELQRLSPDALIAGNEDIVHELEKRHVYPGKDFPFACMDVKAKHSWSGIQSLFPEVGRRCVELLDEMIAHREVGMDRAWIQVVVRGKWIDGNSM